MAGFVTKAEIYPSDWHHFTKIMASLLILPERRPDRQYNRHVKIKMSDYKRNPGRPPTKKSK